MEEEVHTFRAPSLQDALSLVRKRLGRGALILQSREVEAAGIPFLGWSGRTSLIEVQAVAEEFEADPTAPLPVDFHAPPPLREPAESALPEHPPSGAQPNPEPPVADETPVAPDAGTRDSAAPGISDAAVAAWKPKRRRPLESEPTDAEDFSGSQANVHEGEDSRASKAFRDDVSTAAHVPPVHESHVARPQGPAAEASAWEALEDWRLRFGRLPAAPQDPLALRLVLRGIAPDLAQRLVEEARSAAGPHAERASLHEALVSALAERLPTTPPAARPERARCLTVVGGAGVGKTTLLLRLAAELRSQFGKSTTFVRWRPPRAASPAPNETQPPPAASPLPRTARRRSGAGPVLAPTQAGGHAAFEAFEAEALRAAAAEAGATFVEIESPRDWRARAALAAGADVVLLDLPGATSREEMKLREIQFFLKQAPVANVYVALHAAWSAAGCREAMQAWSELSPAGGVVVHGDAASDWSAALSATAAAAAPIVTASLGEGAAGAVFRPSTRELAERWLAGLDLG